MFKSSFILRLLCMALCAVFILSAASCTGDGNNGGDTTADSTAVETTEKTALEETEPESYVNKTFEEADVPAQDWGGDKFTVLYPDEAPYTIYLFSEEDTGEVVSASLFARDLAVEEKMNIELEYVNRGGIGEVATALKTSVTAGDNAYDLVVTHAVSGVSEIVVNSLAYNWHDVPNVDLLKSYWNQSANSELSVNGILPLASGDLILPYPNSIFFNKEIIESYGLEDPYTLVKEGKWTLDKFIEIADSVYKDENGNGERDNSDTYGWCSEVDWMYTDFLYGCDQYVTAKDEEGIPRLAINTEKTVAILEKLYNLLYNSSGAFNMVKNASTGDSSKYIAFDSGRALFYFVPLAKAADYRATEVDFGILPLPKYDEAQQNYIAFNWGGLMCVPISSTGDQLKQAGAVAELLNCETSRTVIPAYFDVMLNSKITRDVESSEMLDIIYGNLVYDFGVSYSNHDAMAYALASNLSSGSNNFASWYKTREKSAAKMYENVANAFAKIYSEN